MINNEIHGQIEQADVIAKPKKSKLFLENDWGKVVPETEAPQHRERLQQIFKLWMDELQKIYDAKLILPEDPLLILTEDRNVPFFGDLVGSNINFVIELEQDGETWAGMVDTTGTSAHGGMNFGVYEIQATDGMLVVNTHARGVKADYGQVLGWGSVDAPGAPQSEGIDQFQFKKDEDGNFEPYNLKNGSGSRQRTLTVAMTRVSELNARQLATLVDDLEDTGVPDKIHERNKRKEEEEKPSYKIKKFIDRLFSGELFQK